MLRFILILGLAALFISLLTFSVYTISHSTMHTQVLLENAVMDEMDCFYLLSSQ